MVNFNGDKGHNPAEKLGHYAQPGAPGKQVKKCVRDLRQKVIDLKTILVGALEPDEVYYIARNIIDLAVAGNMDAATWIIDRCIGKPINSPEIAEMSEPAVEAPKVVLLDWRRLNEPAPESN
jgi:hypothetical protein